MFQNRNKIFCTWEKFRFNVFGTANLQRNSTDANKRNGEIFSIKITHTRTVSILSFLLFTTDTSHIRDAW